MRKIIVIILLVIMCNILLWLHNFRRGRHNQEIKILPEIEYVEGRYTGKGSGFVGDINVEIVLKKNKFGAIVIIDINVLESEEIKNYWVLARDKIISEILDKQDIEADIVSGATESSQGLIEAIKNARKKAIVRN